MNDIDKLNLRQVILEYPNQLHLGQKFAEHIELPKKEYANLIICGMGGSAIPGDLLANYFQNTSGSPLPIYISRGYNLPREASSDSLVFISSCSGNTEETVSCLEEAIKKETLTVSFCAGGKIEKISVENDVPLVKYSIDFENFQPRYAATFAFAAMHQVLTNLGLCSKISRFPEINSPELENPGKEIAKKIKDKIPVIYASGELKAIAKNWKIKINENAKTPAFWNYFPELNHNEMVGFTNPKGNYFVIFIQGDNENPKIGQRMEITKELYSKKGIQCLTVNIKGNDFLEKMLSGLNLGDWVSYYLALEYNQDPTPVDMVEEFKALMKK